MAEPKTAKDFFDRFKELHPNSPDQYEPDLASIQRWVWSVKEAQERASVGYDKFEVKDQRNAKALALSRGVRSWGRLPEYMRNKFLELASRFPGRQVWATGSRVTGEYIDNTSGINIVRMREALLKKPTKESDYDIIVELKKGDDLDNFRKRLPSWGDLVVNPIKDEPKIEIPMWDFKKLPEDKHATAQELFAKKDWGRLMSLHNDYQLSPVFYCCDNEAVKRWFEWGIKEGLINGDSKK